MGISISGENNNDRILATDGVIDQISGFNVVGVMTATSFSGDLIGNVTGNVTGNINNSTLLLQTGGFERFRITGNNELGIAGANYGIVGQVLTSGGSGSAVSWTTPLNLNNATNNRVITSAGGATLNGEANLTFDGSALAYSAGGAERFNLAHTSGGHVLIKNPSAASLAFATNGNNERLRITSAGHLSFGSSDITKTWSLGKAMHFGVSENALWGEGDYAFHMMQNAYYNGGWKYTHTDEASLYSSADGKHIFYTAASGSADSAITWGERLRITSTGEVGINVTPSNGQMLAVTGRSGYDDIVQVTAVGTNIGARINLTNTGTGVARINATNNDLALQTGGTSRLLIGSEGNLALGGTNTSAYANQSHFFIGGMGNLYADTPAGSGASLSLSNNAYINTSANWVYRTGGKATNIFHYDGDIGFRTAGTGSAGNTISWTERLRIRNKGGHKIICDETYYAANLTECNSGLLAFNINKTRQGQTKGIAFGAIGNTTDDTGIQCYDTSNNSANPLLINPFGGTIQCGTSGTLQALINNSVNGHQFISQCSDNNNGFEVYQKHGSNTTRNTFAVYANTGSSGAKKNQLSVRGDGLVTVDGNFDFNAFVPDGTITTTLSSNSASGNYTTIIPLNTSGIGHAQTYLVSIFWNYNSSGSSPYYCAGGVLWGTPHSNSGGGTNYPIEILSSAHITGSYYLKIRNITGSSSYPGLQAANIGWTAQSGSQYIVKYKRMY